MGKNLPSLGHLPSLGIASGIKAGLKKVNNKIGELGKRKEKPFSYKSAASEARLKWSNEPGSLDDFKRNFVKGCIVFAAVNVLEKEKRHHLAAFGEREAWSSAAELTIDVGGEGGGGGGEDAPEPGAVGSVNDMFSVGSVNDIFSLGSGDNNSPNSPTLAGIYNPFPVSPVHSRMGGNLDSPGSASIRSQEGQENFWAVVERVFLVKPKPVDEVPEVVVTEETVKPRRVYVEPRIKYTWQERTTWIDDAIKVSNDNYAGGDGGAGSALPDLLRKTAGVPTVPVKDFKKRGEAWAGRRMRIAAGFGKLLKDSEESRRTVQLKLFKHEHNVVR